MYIYVYNCVFAVFGFGPGSRHAYLCLDMCLCMSVHVVICGFVSVSDTVTFASVCSVVTCICHFNTLGVR